MCRGAGRGGSGVSGPSPSPPRPAPVSPSHTLHAGVGEAGGLIRCQLHPCLSLLWGLDAPSIVLTPPRLGLPGFLLRPTPPPHPPPDPSPPTSSGPAGRGNRDWGLQEPHSPHSGHVLPATPAPGGGGGVVGGRISRRPLALLNPLSLKCKELWNQTASHSNLGCLFLAGSAPRFRDADLRVSGSGVSNSDAYRVLASDWGGQVWNSVPFGVTSLTQPQPISPGGGDESLVLPDLIFFFF